MANYYKPFIKQFGLFIFILLLLSPSHAEHNIVGDTSYESQSLEWEHEQVFYDLLAWAHDTGVVTQKQAQVIKNELEERLTAFAANKGYDVEARRKIYTFISSRVTVTNIVIGLLLLCLFAISLGVVLYFIYTPSVFFFSIILYFIWWSVCSHLWEQIQWQLLGGSLFIIPVALAASAGHGLSIIIGWTDYPTDIAVIVLGKEERIDRWFFYLSMCFGLVVILTGGMFENDNNYLGFWFYMIGGFTFSLGLLPITIYDTEIGLFNEMVTLVSNACLVYATTSPQRFILGLYGLIGFLVFVVKPFIKAESKITDGKIYIRALFSVLLLSLSITRLQPNSDPLSFNALSGMIELISSHLLLLMFHLTWFRQPERKNKVFNYTAHLLTSIGIVGLSRLFKGIYFPFVSSVITFDCGSSISAVSAFGVLLNHMLALTRGVSQVFDINEHKSGLTHSLSRYSGLGPFMNKATVTNSRTHQTKEIFTYWTTTRLIVIITVGFLSLLTPTKSFARTSVMSLIFFIWIEFIYKSPNHDRLSKLLGPHWVIACISFCMSEAFSFDYLSWGSFICICIITQMSLKHRLRNLTWMLPGFFGIGTLIDSKLLFLTGFITLVFTLVMVTRRNLTIKTKNKSTNRITLSGMLLLLSSLIILLISGYLLYNYDYYRDLEGSFLHFFSNQVAHCHQMTRGAIQTFLTDEYGPIRQIASMVAWPMPLTAMLTSAGESSSILIIILLTGCLSLLAELGTYIYSILNAETPLDESLPSIMEIDQMTVSFPKDTNQNGLLFGLTGSKPPEYKIEQATLEILGEDFWQKLESILGKEKIDSFRANNYPIKLIPNRMSKTKFNSNFQKIWIQWGTGLNKEPAISQSDIRSTFRKLVNFGDPEITVRVISTTKNSKPKKAVLWEFDVKVSVLLNSLREAHNLQPLLDEWESP